MKKILLMAAVAVFAISSAYAQEKNFIDQAYVEITGRADMEVTPDIIYLNIVINEADSKGKATLPQTEKKMFQSLKSIGVDLEKDLTVSDMSSDLRSYLLKKNTVQTMKTYQLKVNSAAMMQKVFGALAEVGVSDVNVAKVDVSNIKELRNEVRAQAVKAAQENAATLATSIGQKIGKALFIQDYGYSARPFANVMMAKSAVMDSAAEGASEPQLEYEKIKIEHSVLVRFALD